MREKIYNKKFGWKLKKRCLYISSLRLISRLGFCVYYKDIEDGILLKFRKKKDKNEDIWVNDD